MICPWNSYNSPDWVHLFISLSLNKLSSTDMLHQLGTLHLLSFQKAYFAIRRYVPELRSSVVCISPTLGKYVYALYCYLQFEAHVFCLSPELTAFTKSLFEGNSK